MTFRTFRGLRAADRCQHSIELGSAHESAGFDGTLFSDFGIDQSPGELRTTSDDLSAVSPNVHIEIRSRVTRLPVATLFAKASQIRFRSYRCRPARGSGDAA